MSDPLNRGHVVARGRLFSVVWAATDSELVLLPILRPRRRMAGDVALELSDLVACAVTLPEAVIRPRPNAPTRRKGWVVVGMVPGATMCRVSQGAVRVELEARCHEKWSLDDRHRENARDRCVKVVG